LETKQLIIILLGIDISLLLELILNKQDSKKMAYRFFLPSFVFISNIIVTIALIAIDREISFKMNFENFFKGIDIFILGLFICGISIVSFIISAVKYRYVGVGNVDRRYRKFTKNIADGGNIKLFVGDLSFLGRIMNYSSCGGKKSFLGKIFGRLNISENDYKKLMLEVDDCKLCKRHCKQVNNIMCILKSKQFIQLMKLHTKIKLDIFCRKLDDEHFFALLGKLISVFGANVTIRFYDEDVHRNIYILARIRSERTGDVMLWHWKYDSGKYTIPQEYRKSDKPHDKDPAGDTLFYLIDELFWKKYSPIGEEERNKCLSVFHKVIGES